MILSLVVVLLVMTPLVAYYGVMPAMKGGIGQSPTLSQMNATVWTFTGASSVRSLIEVFPIFLGCSILIVFIIIILLGKDRHED